MAFRANSLRLAALCAVLGTSACTAPQPKEDVFYDPWDRYELGRAYACDEREADMKANTMNSASHGFGCSHQTNITLMVAQQSDLHEPRAMTPVDPVARQRVLEDYRKGNDTSRATKASGTQELLK